MSKKSYPFVYSEHTIRMGQDFLDKQYMYFLQFNYRESLDVLEAWHHCTKDEILMLNLIREGV